MAVLITGGAGFIGSRLALALRQRGESLVLLDNFNNYYDPRLKRDNIAMFAADSAVRVVEGDVRDAALLDQVVRENNITHIAHLAAMAGVRNSIEEAHLYFEVNLMGSLNVMESARKYHVQQVVQASTSSVYGETHQVPFVESDAADRPLAPYPASKRAAEIMAHSFHHLFGLNVNVLRFFNVYGPQGRPDMMPMKVIRALLTDQPITLFNKGNFSRDWTYIDDVVDGVIAALYRPLGYDVFNLGYGGPISMREFIDIFEEISGKQAIIVDATAPLSEPPITYCDNTHSRDVLGFAPKVNVVEGLKRTWDWYVSQANNTAT